MRASPRPRAADWHAQRPGPVPERETYVFVIGESVRSDRVPGCGGRPEVMSPPPSALLYCDVLAGASGTHASVPLLISRDLPGGRVRVPRDATFQKAFEAVGFETFWLGVQERAIAWPDAGNVALDIVPGMDRERLLPFLQQALARRDPRKMIVLHAYNAHSPYIDRYDPAVAPFRVDAALARTGSPRRETLPQWWNNYDNAVDESMRFLRQVTAQLQSQPGEAFLVFTPDHAENMLDDGRGLLAHALARPTLWDTRVPAIVWANEAWRRAHPARWRMLAANVKSPLMHMDMVPTLLGASGIQYAEPRTLPVDLGAHVVPPRVRFTQLRPGQTVTLDTLAAEAQED
jgi:glucan phosphoethanolaminetransferase (alkaline phosphatase superfamily)